MALDPTLNGYLMWTLAQHVQDLEQASTPREEAIRRVAAAALVDYADVAWACHLHPDRSMPDERIFPIPPEDLEMVRMLERNLANP
jgi:hypothetical protein